MRARAEETFDRGVSASGVMRQMLAILNQPNRSQALGSLRMPAAVVHGSADKMVHVSGGRATARVIPGAELLVIDGMGHDMPTELFETLHRDHPAYGGPGGRSRPVGPDRLTAPDCRAQRVAARHCAGAQSSHIRSRRISSRAHGLSWSSANTLRSSHGTS